MFFLTFWEICQFLKCIRNVGGSFASIPLRDSIFASLSLTSEKIFSAVNLWACVNRA